MEEFVRRYRFVALLALCLAAGWIGFHILKPFYPALLWGLVLTVLMHPVYRRFRARFSANLSAIGTVVTTILIVIVPLSLVGTALAFQIGGTLEEAQAQQRELSDKYVVEQIEAILSPILKKVTPDTFDLSDYYLKNRTELLKSIGSPIQEAIFKFGYGAFTLVVALLSMFFMVRDGHRLRDPALELIPLDRDRSAQLLKRIGDTIQAVFVGVILVALIQATVAGITYWIVGVPAPFLWAVATFLLCIFPLLGAPIVYVPLSLYLASQQMYWQAGVLLGVGFLVVSNIDNLLRPFVIGARVELHPLAVFFFLLGGVFFFGPVGLMAGPMVLTLLLAIQDVVREKLREAQPA